MRTILLLIFFNLIFHVSFGQPGYIKFKQELASSKSYTSAINAYIHYGDKYGTENFDTLFTIATEGIHLAGLHRDTLSIAILSRYLGQVYYFAGKYDKAAAEYYNSINMLGAVGNLRQLALSFNSLAQLFRKTKDFAKALENYDKALSIFKKNRDSTGMAMIYNESGVVYEYKQEYGEALKRYTLSLDIDQKLKDDKGIAYALSNIGGIYTIEKKYPEAEKKLLEAMAICIADKDTFALALNYNDLASVFFEAGNNVKARQYADISNTIADKMKDLELKKNNYELLAQIAEKEQNYKDAYRYHKLETLITDSIYTIQKSKQIEELNTKYNTVEKEKQLLQVRSDIASKEADISKKDIFLTLSILSLALLIIIIILIIRYNRSKALLFAKESELRLQVSTVEAASRLQHEKSRISRELHDNIGSQLTFINSSLENMKSQYSEDQGIVETQGITLNTIKDLRNTVWLIHNENISMDEFIIRLRDYFKPLYNSPELIQIKAEGESSVIMQPVLVTNLFRIVQEAVNNAIKYSHASRIEVDIRVELSSIKIHVTDNGKGFDVRSVIKGSGLNNMEQRATDIRGKIDIISEINKGTSVQIECTV